MSKVSQREFLLGLYPGEAWRQKVSKMSDAQVYAVFVRTQAAIEKKWSKK